MLILVTNDDGIHSPGLAALVAEARKLGEVAVVAPMQEQSGVSHSITVNHPLRTVEVEREGEFFGHGIYGAPADCVKLALSELLDGKPDLVLSGVNAGANTGVNVHYSGTVAAAIEGAMLGIPSVAVSLKLSASMNFAYAARVGVEVARAMLAHHKAHKSAPLLNVNVPPLPPEELKGIRITRQFTGPFRESFERRHDPRGGQYFWGTVDAAPDGVTPDSDIRAIQDGFVSITPLHFDMTDEEFSKEALAWGWDEIASGLGDKDNQRRAN